MRISSKEILRWPYAALLVTVFSLPACDFVNSSGSYDLGIRIMGTKILDADGNRLLLRGINVGGASKLPSRPNAQSHDSDFLQGKNISFVGRPLPLNTAAEHFQRIRNWGFNFIRLVMTWEAITPNAPDQFDQAYLDYLDQLIQIAADHKLRVLLDMHQDVWSRWTGGSGAPRWTLEKVGFRADALQEHGATILHNATQDYPYTVWPTNHSKLAAATMFTLFWAGNTYAPDHRVAGQSAQDFLQSAYIGAWLAIASAVGHHKNIIGYDLMNEPGLGFIGLESLQAWKSKLQLGPMPSPAQAMFAAEISQVVNVYEFNGLGFNLIGTQTMNPNSASIWHEGIDDIWQSAGVWSLEADQPTILKTNYFQHDTAVAEFIAPFYQKLARELQTVDENAIVFIEPSAEFHEMIPWPESVGVPAVYAAHWYDAYTLIQREFDPEFSVDTTEEISLVIGQDQVQELFIRQLRHIRNLGHQQNLPVLIGEFGLPFDPEESDFATRIQALKMYYTALEANDLSSALWHYNPQNNAEFGDGWNREDFSVISIEHPEGRALEGYKIP